MNGTKCEIEQDGTILIYSFHGCATVTYRPYLRFSHPLECEGLTTQALQEEWIYQNKVQEIHRFREAVAAILYNGLYADQRKRWTVHDDSYPGPAYRMVLLWFAGALLQVLEADSALADRDVIQRALAGVKRKRYCSPWEATVLENSVVSLPQETEEHL